MVFVSGPARFVTCWPLDHIGFAAFGGMGVGTVIASIYLARGSTTDPNGVRLGMRPSAAPVTR